MPKSSLTQKEWDSIVCPDEIAEKVLTSAGYDFRGCKIYQGSKAVSPYTMQKETVLTWPTVGYFLKDKGLIDFEEEWQCVKAVKEYYNMIKESAEILTADDLILDEDFGIGVGGLTGADQGIPHGGDCKAVVAFRMDGGKPKRRIYFKKKKKKTKKG